MWFNWYLCGMNTHFLSYYHSRVIQKYYIFVGFFFSTKEWSLIFILSLDRLKDIVEDCS